MKSVRETQKKYCSRAIMVAIVIAFGFILAQRPAIGKGLILGTLFSILNFVLMGEMLPLRVGKSAGRTFFVSLGSMLFRYALMAVPLILAIKFDQFNLPAAAVGLFLVQVMILADHLKLWLFPGQKQKQFPS